MNSSHYEGGPDDRTLCGVPIEGVWIVPDTHPASCKACRVEKDRRAAFFLNSLLGKGMRVAVNEPKFISITLEEFEGAIVALEYAKLDVSANRFSSSPEKLKSDLASKILRNAIQHLTRRLQRSLVGHE